MAKNLDPATIAQKWAANTGSQAAQTAYKAGIQAQTVSPTQLAATPQAESLYIQGVQNSVQSGRRAAALNGVSLASWQNAAITKGAPRLSSGAQAAVPKFQAFVTKYAPVWSQIRATVAGMPKGGIDNAVNRVRQSIQMLMQAAGTA